MTHKLQINCKAMKFLAVYPSIIQRNPISCAMNISIVVAVTPMTVVVLYLEHFHAANVLRATWGPKTIEIFAHTQRMVTECECECECECPLSTSRPTVRIVVLFVQWAVCDDPGVCVVRVVQSFLEWIANSSSKSNWSSSSKFP